MFGTLHVPHEPFHIYLTGIRYRTLSAITPLSLLIILNSRNELRGTALLIVIYYVWSTRIPPCLHVKWTVLRIFIIVLARISEYSEINASSLAMPNSLCYENSNNMSRSADSPAHCMLQMKLPNCLVQFCLCSLVFSNWLFNLITVPYRLNVDTYVYFTEQSRTVYWMTKSEFSKTQLMSYLFIYLHVYLCNSGFTCRQTHIKTSAA
jgi:hypothetical protein